MNIAFPVCVGINLSAEYLDVALGADGPGWVAGNNEPDMEATADRLIEVAPSLVLIACTGEAAWPLLSELYASGVPTVLVDRGSVHAIAQSLGLKSVPERIDAHFLAHVAEEWRPHSLRLAKEVSEELSELVARRHQLLMALSDEKYRRLSKPLSKRSALDQRIALLHLELAEIARQIQESVKPINRIAMRTTANGVQGPAGAFSQRRSFSSRYQRLVSRLRGSVGRQRVRLRAVGVLALLVFGFAGLFAKQIFFPPPAQDTAGHVIDVTGSMQGFSQSVIHVRLGQPVTVRLLNAEHRTAATDEQHQWAVDELGINLIVQAGESKSVTFTPNKAGSFTFYCEICCGGRANPAMNGILVVDG